MKSFMILVIFITAFFIGSCNKDKDPHEEYAPSIAKDIDPIENKMVLVKQDLTTQLNDQSQSTFPSNDPFAKPNQSLAPVDPHAGHDHSKDDHSGHNHGNPSSEKSNKGHEGHNYGNQNISVQALINMNVKTANVKKSDFTIYHIVPATINSKPLNERPIYAPVSGRIKSIKIESGIFLKGDTLTIEIIRAPIPKIELTMIADILSPASEEYHNVIAEVRLAKISLDVLNSEQTRLNKFNSPDGISIVPQKNLIEIKYKLEKARQQHRNLQNKLKLHGLTETEIQRIENGNQISRLPNFWLNALKQNNIWNNKSMALHEAIAKSKHQQQWIIASIGELTAEELISDQLIKWIKNDKTSSDQFLRIARLLQDGHSLIDIQSLHKMGALADIVKINTPASSHGWDVEHVHIKKGQNINLGDKLITLTDHSEMFIEVRPQGKDIAYLNNALKEDKKMLAEPLIKNSSINLKELKISKLMGTDNREIIVYIPVSNKVLKMNTINNRQYRNWHLRNGLKYNLKVPIRAIKDVIVLPSKALVQHGSDKIIFVREGNEFIRRNVVVIYQDNESVVIGQGSDLRTGEPMVIEGAFALQLALIAGTPQAVDPHAGHNH